MNVSHRMKNIVLLHTTLYTFPTKGRINSYAMYLIVGLYSLVQVYLIVQLSQLIKPRFWDEIFGPI